MNNFLIFLVIVFVYVFIYNMGMFIPAKIFNVRVEKFYVWFNPFFSIFKYKGKNSNTEFGLGWLPLGGFCAFSGMPNTEYEERETVMKPYYFSNKPIWQQLTIIFGGPISNLIIGLVSYSYLKSTPVSGFLNIFFILSIIAISIFVFYFISYLSKSDVKKRKFSKLGKLLFSILSLVLYLSILFLLLFNINEVVPLEKYLIEILYNKTKLKDLIFPLTPERTKILAAYFGILFFILNLIPHSSSNGYRVIRLLYKSFTGLYIPEKFTNTVGTFFMIICFGFFAYIIFI